MYASAAAAGCFSDTGIVPSGFMGGGGIVVDMFGSFVLLVVPEPAQDRLSSGRFSSF